MLINIRDKVEKVTNEAEFNKFKESIRDAKPYTIWDEFVKVYTKNWESGEFRKNMEAFYALRCKTAHSNSFTKTDFDKFEEVYVDLNNVIESTIHDVEMNSIVIDDATIALLNEAADELDIENIIYDTLIVPARQDGFEEVFLGENQ